MPPIDFPNSPTIGQTFTSGIRTWQWDGVVWTLVQYGVQGNQGNQGNQGAQTSVAGTANQVLVNGQTGFQSGNVTLSLPQNIHTSATPSFSTVTSTVATGTPPFAVTSTTLVPNLNADLLDGLDSTVFAPPGMIVQFAGFSAPTGWLFADGSSVSRTTYPSLFSALTTTVSTVTISNANPAFVTFATPHFLSEGDGIYFTTTGTLPTGLSPNVGYFAKYINSTTIQVSSTRTTSVSGGAAASFAAGASIATSSAGSGTHTLIKAPYGIPSSTNFNLPDLRGRVAVGLDSMSGSDAARLTLPNALGGATGFETHTMVLNEMPAHSHTQTLGGSLTTVEPVAGSGIIGTANTSTVTSAGGGLAHNNLQPLILLNYIIKT